MGLFDDGRLGNERFVSTTSFVDNPRTLLDEIATDPAPLAYCSVSPLAEQSLKEWAVHSGLEPFNLSNDSYGNFPITYPCPDEVGQDRIANSFAVHRTSELPVIVIDVGTATTFDIVGQEEGYMGGVIAPGPQGFLDFLHQNTALLPEVRLAEKMPSDPIGKNTSDAMLLGIHLGFEPMVNGILRPRPRSSLTYFLPEATRMAPAQKNRVILPQACIAIWRTAPPMPCLVARVAPSTT